MHVNSGWVSIGPNVYRSTCRRPTQVVTKRSAAMRLGTPQRLLPTTPNRQTTRTRGQPSLRSRESANGTLSDTTHKCLKKGCCFCREIESRFNPTNLWSRFPIAIVYLPMTASLTSRLAGRGDDKKTSSGRQMFGFRRSSVVTRPLEELYYSPRSSAYETDR